MEEEQSRGVNPNIPQEIVEDIILVKLPVKSLGRFKAVSREWRGAIDSNRFIEKHMRYQKSLQGSGHARFLAIPRKEIKQKLSPLENQLLSRSGKRDTPPLGNLLLSSNGVLRASPYPPIMYFPRDYDFKISTSCDGLFCLYTKSRILHLVNPATTSHRVILDPISQVSGHLRRSLVGIGKESGASPMYKLLCYFNDDMVRLVNNSTRCKVFALDSNSWRYVDDPPVGGINYNQPMMHLDGVVYSLGYMRNNYLQQEDKLLAFDLHTETFQSFPITLDIGFTYTSDVCIGVLNHHICIFKRCVRKADPFFKIWFLDRNK